MISSTQRQKLLHSIIYFVENTERCQKLKLFKLLAHLDFEHFKETGRTVTGLDYYALEKGPVPRDLNSELRGTVQDLDGVVGVSTVANGNDWHVVKFKALQEFNTDLFSRRELKILKRLAEEYRDALGAKMIDSTHLPNDPWDIAYRSEPGSLIDPLTALGEGSISEDLASERAATDKAVQSVFG